MITNVPATYANDREDILEAKPTFHPGFVKTKDGRCFFNREAFDSFMDKNKFSLMIRSQNPCQDGYAMDFDRRCLTIFSARKCNKMALANTAIIQIDRSKEKVRFVQLTHSEKK